MCACNQTWTVLHVLWSVIYIGCGALQLIAGIFFVVSLSELFLISNICSGSWTIIIGVCSGILACVGKVSIRRQECLLFMAVSILTVNVVNILLSEWRFYKMDIAKILQEHQDSTLIYIASYAVRIGAAVVIGISFLDTQLSFCSLQIIPKTKKNKLPRPTDQLSDIEYIIPRQKSSSSSTKQSNSQSVYARSWVFDAEDANCSNNNQDDVAETTTYLKTPSNGVPNTSVKLQNNINEMGNGYVKPNGTALVVEHPVVQVEEVSEDGSAKTSDRKLNYMKSFSRSTSPAILSACSSQLSLNAPQSPNVPIYECLEKLTEPSVYRSRLNTALSNRDESECHYQAPKPIALRRPETPQEEKVQYASLMKELQKAIGNKKDPNSGSSSESNPTSNNDCKNSDAEFSKELEAALQLIHDLESPNTAETISNDAKCTELMRPTWRSESEKTLNAIGSSELTSPMAEFQTDLTSGKSAPCVVVLNSDSQSTSGYSSPSHKANWSTSSSLSEGNNELGKPLSYSIHNTKSTAVISLYSHDTLQSKSKAITLVTITGDNRPLQTLKTNEDNETNQTEDVLGDLEGSSARRPSVGSSHGWGVKSILRKKKHSLPKLCPELEGAIFKSESLAYLSDVELLERHKRNKDIERQIEQRVQRQISFPAKTKNYKH